MAQLTFVFRRPVFPVICAFGDHLESADSLHALTRLLDDRDLRTAAMIRMIDGAAEEWKFLGEAASVAPRSPVRFWKKRDVIELFTTSRNAVELDCADAALRFHNRTVQRIIIELAALVAGANRSATVGGSG